MRTLKSNDELFGAVDEVIARIEREGPHDAASILKDGFRSINGLTDGWGLFMESLERALGVYSDKLSNGAKNDQRAILHATTKAVYH